VEADQTARAQSAISRAVSQANACKNCVSREQFRPVRWWECSKPPSPSSNARWHDRRHPQLVAIQRAMQIASSEEITASSAMFPGWPLRRGHAFIDYRNVWGIKTIPRLAPRSRDVACRRSRNLRSSGHYRRGLAAAIPPSLPNSYRSIRKCSPTTLHPRDAQPGGAADSNSVARDRGPPLMPSPPPMTHSDRALRHQHHSLVMSCSCAHFHVTRPFAVRNRSQRAHTVR